MYRLTGYCVCEHWDLTEISSFLQTQEGFVSYTLTLFDEDVLRVADRGNPHRLVFLFSYGCVSFFHTSEAQETAFMQLLTKLMVEAYEQDDWEFEDLQFTYGDKFQVKNDVITLASARSLEKLAVAFALAQCVKLSIFENRIETQIELNREIPEAIANYGHVPLSRKEISSKIGRLFIDRNNINLHSDVLNTPDFFWEQDAYKPQYDHLSLYLELTKRVNLLNQRLDLMKELFDMLGDQLDRMHSDKLEWVIVVLIAVEIIIMVVWNIIIKDMMGLF